MQWQVRISSVILLWQNGAVQIAETDLQVVVIVAAVASIEALLLAATLAAVVDHLRWTCGGPPAPIMVIHMPLKACE